MAFKYRLICSFLILTILPLFAAGWVIEQLSARNQENRADYELGVALLGGGQDVQVRVSEAERRLERLAADRSVQRALREGDRAALQARLAGNPMLRVDIAAMAGNDVIAGVQPPDSVVAARTGESGDVRPQLVAYVRLPDLAEDVEPEDDGHARLAVVHDGRVYRAGGDEAAAPRLQTGRPFRLSLFGDEWRASAAPIEALGDLTLVATYPQERLDDHIRGAVLRVIAAGLIATLMVALLAGFLLRSLTTILRRFAERARAVSEGRFDERLPAHGRDEFAQFGQAFNDMSQQLERRIGELETERRRVREATDRFGSTLAASHDVAALLEILLDAAMQRAGALGGRLLVADEGSTRLVEQLRVGDTAAAAAFLDEVPRIGEGVEGRALQGLQPVVTDEPAPALSAPLLTERTVLGLLTLVSPEGGSFDEETARAVGALAAQGAIAIENARLHRLIQKQARTDGLTGLANHRELQETLAREVERAGRFGVPLSLVFIDLDDFKAVNDRYGHLAGDTILRAAAQAVHEEIREIDTAARYGGEELAVVLPHTSSDGAVRLAERLRQAIARLIVAAGDGGTIRITASLGVAAVPGDATTQVELIAVADAALYRAKQAGKNRVEAGVPRGSTTPA